MAQPKKKSLFAQRMLAHREAEDSAPATPIPADQIQQSFGTRSYVVSGEDATSIHQDNLSNLSRMSQEEIQAERNKLLSTVDPNIVAFLRNRRKQNACDNPMDTDPASPVPSEPGSSSTAKVNDSCAEPESKVGEIQELKELVHKYPHMDTIEDEKLQWIGDLPMDKSIPKDPFPARFNFEGELLPYIDKGEGVLKGLHNHGEEQERPGYTLQELMQLSRSAVLQQRVIALTTISNILAKASKYENAFQEPLLPLLLEADMYLLLRFSLDDPSQRIVMASAGAICNLIVNHSDEVCLDVIMGTPLGLQQPSLGVCIDIKQSECDELKDAELLKLDVIRGMMRTNILERFRYVLDKLEIEPIEIKQTLKTLTRMCRHSYEITNAVFSIPDLLGVIFRNLLNVNSSTAFYPEALKLFRVIAARSRSLAENIIEKFGILDVLFQFIAGDRAQGHPEAMHLSLESFYTWQTFLSYNLAVETIRAVGPVIHKLLTAHFGYTSLDSSKSDLEHATAIITTISAVAKLETESVTFLLPLAYECGLKWVTQYSESLNPNFSASKLIGAILQLFALTYESIDCSNLENNVEKLFKKKAVSRCFQRLRTCSWLISGRIISNPENLPCLGSVPPTLLPTSSLPAVYSLSAFLLASNNNKLKNLFLGEEELFIYLKAVFDSSNFRSLCGHWYARQELCLLVSLIHLYSKSMFTDNHRFIHRLAFTLMTVVQEGDKFLLGDLISNAVLNEKYFTFSVDDISERLDSLRLEEESSPQWAGKRETLQKSITSLPEIRNLYMRELGLEHLQPTWPPSTLTGMLNSTQPAFPSDWIFLPIMRLHQCEGKDKNAASTVALSLKWFVIIEEFSPDLLANIRPSAKYCRLCCVYLAGPDLFRDVISLLGLALSYITAKHEDLDFEETIPGLSSFYDFYRELLEQYTAVSYCDVVFGRYVLVPLSQKHDVKYKKIVWSELAAILRLLRTPVEEVDMKQYLEPTETDANMLMTYLQAVATGRVREAWCPVLYKVAFHQVVNYIQSHSDRVSEVLRDRIVKLGNTELRSQFLNSCQT